MERPCALPCPFLCWPFNCTIINPLKIFVRSTDGMAPSSFTCVLTPSSTHSPTQQLTHSTTHSLIHQLNNSLPPSLACLLSRFTDAESAWNSPACLLLQPPTHPAVDASHPTHAHLLPHIAWEHVCNTCLPFSSMSVCVKSMGTVRMHFCCVNVCLVNPSGCTS